MTAIYLYDDQCARTFEPFALTRPAGEMRAGALLVRERWARALDGRVAGHVTSPHLAGFEEPDAAPVIATGTLPRGVPGFRGIEGAPGCHRWPPISAARAGWLDGPPSPSLAVA